MLRRIPVVLVVLILCPKDIWSQQNDATIATGSSKSTNVHTKRNVIQKSVNQMPPNQGIHIDLQQRLNAWRAANLQAQKNSQGLNQPAAILQPTTAANTQNNDPHSTASPNVVQDLNNHPSLSNNLQAQTFQNIQNIQVDSSNIKNENIANSQSQNVVNTDTASTQNVQQVLQFLQLLQQQQQAQNLQQQQQTENLQQQQQQQTPNLQTIANVPVHTQKLPQQTFNVPPPAETQYLTLQKLQATTPQDKSANIKPNPEMTHVNLHPVNIPREVPVEQSQNQHFLLPSSPAQLIDQSSLQNLFQYSPHLTQSQNSIHNGVPHQITTNPLQPSTSYHSNPQTYTQNQIYPGYPSTFGANQTPLTNMYEAQSGISRIGSSDSHMRTLLPIIYSLLRDSNDCGCCNHRCNCSQMRRNQQQSVRQGSENGSVGKFNDKQDEGKHETSSRKVNNKKAKSNASESELNRRMKGDKHQNEKIDKSYEDYYSEEDFDDDESNYID